MTVDPQIVPAVRTKSRTGPLIASATADALIPPLAQHLFYASRFGDGEGAGFLFAYVTILTNSALVFTSLLLTRKKGLWRAGCIAALLVGMCLSTFVATPDSDDLAWIVGYSLVVTFPGVMLFATVWAVRWIIQQDRLR